jgi:DNA-binding transcriptional ArsR family regulator
MEDSKPYRAIVDANRRKILDLLRIEGPLRAGEIVAHLPTISQPAVSKHLRILRETGLVRSVPDGRERSYHLNAIALQQVADWLRHYEALWDARLATLKALAEDAETEGDTQIGYKLA